MNFVPVAFRAKQTSALEIPAPAAISPDDEDLRLALRTESPPREDVPCREGCLGADRGGRRARHVRAEALVHGALRSLCAGADARARRRHVPRRSDGDLPL